MKFIAIAALVATASATDKAQGEDCSASGAKCASALCCGKIVAFTGTLTGTEKKMDKPSSTLQICNTKDSKKFSLTTTETSSDTKYKDYLTSGKDKGTYVADFKCNPAAGASALSAAAAVLAASYYMA